MGGNYPFFEGSKENWEPQESRREALKKKKGVTCLFEDLLSLYIGMTIGGREYYRWRP